MDIFLLNWIEMWLFIPDVSPVTLQLDLNGMYHLETVQLSFKVSATQPRWRYLIWKCCFLTGPLVCRARGLTRWSWRGPGISGAPGSLSCTWPATAPPPSPRWARRSLDACRTRTATHCPPPQASPTATRRYDHHTFLEAHKGKNHQNTHIYDTNSRN